MHRHRDNICAAASNASLHQLTAWEENPFWGTRGTEKGTLPSKKKQQHAHATTMTTPSPPPSNGNEDLMKSTTTNDSSSIRLTLQVDNTSALPIFLQGRVSGEENNGVKKT